MGNYQYEHLVDKWIRLYTEEGLTTTEIAEQSPTTGTTVCEYLQRANINLSQKEHQHLADEWERLYVKEKMSQGQIAEKYDVHQTTVGDYLRERGVQIRSTTQTEESLKDLIRNRSKQDERSGCWVWQGATHASGHGSVKIDNSNRSHGAHRIAYKAFVGSPEEIVRHQCDRPNCVNPDHLTTGTRGDNMRDQFQTKKDLHALTQDDLRDILGREEEDWLRIAEDHDVRLATVRYILEEK